MKDLDIIGISGKLGTGKDFIASRYFFPLGYKQWSFAWHFKIWIAGKGEATYDELFHTKPPKIRNLLQQEGTERGRDVYGENVWVNTAFSWMELLNEVWGFNKFIIPDVRFPNEADAILDRGGRVFRIIAPIRDANSGASEEARNHLSETALDNYPKDKFSGFILNDPEYSNSVGIQVNKLLGYPPVIEANGIDEEEDANALDDLWNSFEETMHRFSRIFGKRIL